jgi:hypothetical protein
MQTSPDQQPGQRIGTCPPRRRSESRQPLAQQALVGTARLRPNASITNTSPPAAPLDPAIAPLRRGSAGLQVLTEGVWSGGTGPWAAPAFIRRWLQHQVPALPADLALCLDPQ